MPVLPLVDAAPLLPARGALIGLDLGTKTIGVAASDPDRRLATPVRQASCHCILTITGTRHVIDICPMVQ